MLKKSNKSRFYSYSVRNSLLIISHITFRDCRPHIFPTTFLEIAVYMMMMMMMMMMINFISVSGLLAGHVRPTNRGH